jgi:hypothetical protein
LFDELSFFIFLVSHLWRGTVEEIQEKKVREKESGGRGEEKEWS